MMRQVCFLFLFQSLFISVAWASEYDDLKKAILGIEKEWAETYYKKPALKSEQKEKKYNELLAKVTDLEKKFPNQAEPIVWEGILTSNLAGVIGLKDKMSMAENAVTIFEKSLKKNPNALYASAHINLGQLYSELPGIISIGDMEKAEKHFLEAKQIMKDSLDINFQYAKFLLKRDEDGDKDQAKKFLEYALQIKSRPEQQYADDQLRIEIETEYLKHWTSTELSKAKSRTRINPPETFGTYGVLDNKEKPQPNPK